MLFDKLSCPDFRVAADFTDHDDCFGFGIGFEQCQQVVVACADNGIAADANTARLAQTRSRSLSYSFISQGAGFGNNAYFSWFVHVSRHDTDLAFAGRDHPWAIGADKP